MRKQSKRPNRSRCNGISAETLVRMAVNHYLNSDNFSGLLISELPSFRQKTVEQIKTLIRPLVEQRRITVRCSSVDVNPLIKGMPDSSPQNELRRFDAWRGGILVVHPARTELEAVVKPKDYSGRPFSLEMALGCAHLDYRTFELHVLEQYRNDPRYYYRVSDVDGYISVKDEHYDGREMKDSDKVLLRHFGFAYNDSMNRAVAVFMTDLCKLSSEHQQIWHHRLLPGDYRLHPIFWETKVQGIWSKHSVITDAFLWEGHRINECCVLMRRPPLFLRDPWQGERPKSFCFLIRPTAKEFVEFCRTLDKLMSDNINRKFFQGEVPEKHESKRNDGKIEVTAKGAITLLKQWLSANWTPTDPAEAESMLAAFREVRNLRNPDSHAFIDDVFDQKFLHEQRELLKRAYNAVRTLRLIFESHPDVRSHADKSDHPTGSVLIY